MNTRLYNARLMTMEKGCSIQENGEVWIRDDTIAYAGPERPTNCIFDREINANGNLIMPGFKNAHTHSAMTFLRSFADDLPLSQWLNQQVFPMEAKLTKEDVYILSKLANLEYLTSGITANYDMYLFPLETAKASAEMGFRTVLCSGLNNFSSSLAQVEQDYKSLNHFHPLISYQIGFHAEYTTSPELLQGLSALARRLSAPVSTHCSETENEVQGCMERYGMTPPAYLHSLGMFDYGGTCFHCVHVTREDLELFARQGVFIVTNPGSNAKLASGIAPLTDMLDCGIPVGIGTDGPASNNCLDFFREMFLATAFQKIRLKDAAALDAEQVLQMAVIGGAHAMGLSDCDCLTPGKRADLILIDLHQPNMQPLNHIAKNIVYSGSKQNVKMTMINGQILYQDGQFHVGCDPEEIYRQANRIIHRMQED